MRIRSSFAFVVALTACNGSSNDSRAVPDAGLDATLPSDDASAPSDANAENDAALETDAGIEITDAGPPPELDAGPPPELEEGSFITHVSSSAGGATGIAIEVAYPATSGARYPNAAPVWLNLPGGHTPGSFGSDREAQTSRENGFIRVDILLPGGSARDEATGSTIASGGRYDQRGPECQRAVADVLLYLLGRGQDEDGETFREKLPFADPTNVGMTGNSNGGNLAVNVLGRYGSEVSDLAWLATWESPIGDQYGPVELQSMGVLNPYYTPGTCSVTSCAWPGLADALRFDPTLDWTLASTNDGILQLDGRLWLDLDANGSRDATDFVFASLPGEDGLVYNSMELAESVNAASRRLFGSAGPPDWMASLTQTEAFWADRDGSLRFQDAHDAAPDVLVMVLGSQDDHVQITPDHPHVIGAMEGWINAGHAFVRLNPDASYLAALSGAAESDLPDYDAGDYPTGANVTMFLVPEMIGRRRIDAHLITASALELADRTHYANESVNLDATLQ